MEWIDAEKQSLSGGRENVAHIGLEIQAGSFGLLQQRSSVRISLLINYQAFPFGPYKTSTDWEMSGVPDSGSPHPHLTHAYGTPIMCEVWGRY